jgi:transcription initiation factor TFIID TATA-box-binding protein
MATNVEICNVVATFNLGTDKKIDLKKIALSARNVEYKPKRFPAVIMRIKKVDLSLDKIVTTTALIFSSGKVVVAGNKSKEAARLSCRRIAYIMKKLGIEAKFMDFKIQNVVGSFAFGKCLRLSILCELQSNFCSYEPELFPGLHWSIHSSDKNEGSIVLLIFTSGKIVITGARDEESILTQHKNICNVLNSMGQCIIMPNVNVIEKNVKRRIRKNGDI